MSTATALTALADDVSAAKAAIEAKGGTAPIGTADMADAIAAIPSGGITPTGKKLITDTSETDVEAFATAQVSSDTLLAENIKKDVNILGIVGSFEGGGDEGWTDLWEYITATRNVDLRFQNKSFPTGTKIKIDTSGITNLTDFLYNAAGFTEVDMKIKDGATLTYFLSSNVGGGLKKVKFNNGGVVKPATLGCLNCRYELTVIDCQWDMSALTSPPTGWMNDNNHVEEVRIVPNTWGHTCTILMQDPNLSNASLVSIANGLNQNVSGMTIGLNATCKAKCSTIHGTVDTSGEYAMFTETGVPTDSTLENFITNVKGWTLA